MDIVSFWWNTETLDSYVTCIRQVAKLLGYGVPHVLEVFNNKLPTKLYWVLLSIEDLRQVVETAKTILTKEKINRQVAGKISSMPFMNIKDGYINKKVTFDTQDSLDKEIDRLTSMMNKSTVQDNDQNKQFQPKIYHSNRRG